MEYNRRTFPTQLLMAVFTPVMIAQTLTWPSPHNTIKLTTKPRVHEEMAKAIESFIDEIIRIYGDDTKQTFMDRMRKKMSLTAFPVSLS